MSPAARGQALRLLAMALLVVGSGLLGAVPVAADDPRPDTWLKPWIDESPMAGNWFGLRDTLNAWGIKPTITYNTDLMASVAGGLQRGQAYAGQLYVEVDTDLGKLAGLQGLRFDVSGDWASGTNLSQDIGNIFTVAQYFEGDGIVRLTNMYLQQSLLDGRLDLKAGRFSTGADFFNPPIDLIFVNEALNPIIVAVQVNVPGVTADPNATWGGRVAVQPTPWFSLATGAYYSDPTLNQLTANGTEFGISTSNGYFLVTEAAFLLHSEKGSQGLPGRYRLGAYYDSNQYASLNHPGRQQTGNYGLYVMGDQMVFREGGPGSSRGLSLFGALIYAPSASINPLPLFASVGATYSGLVPTRDRDIAAFAMYYGGFSRYLPGQTYEMVLEWTYAIAVGRRLTIQPDVQYVINPGGVSSVGNAVVLGLQIGIEF
jgi:porin